MSCPEIKKTAKLILQSLILLSSDFRFKESDAIFFATVLVLFRVMCAYQGEQKDGRNTNANAYRDRGTGGQIMALDLPSIRILDLGCRSGLVADYDKAVIVDLAHIALDRRAVSQFQVDFRCSSGTEFGNRNFCFLGSPRGFVIFRSLRKRERCNYEIYYDD